MIRLPENTADKPKMRKGKRLDAADDVLDHSSPHVALTPWRHGRDR
jgi:hypothetical protein